MRRSTQTIPVVLCTVAFQEVRDIEGYLLAQGIEVVPKPFDLDALLTAVEKALQCPNAVRPCARTRVQTSPLEIPDPAPALQHVNPVVRVSLICLQQPDPCQEGQILHYACYALLRSCWQIVIVFIDRLLFRSASAFLGKKDAPASLPGRHHRRITRLFLGPAIEAVRPIHEAQYRCHAYLVLKPHSGFSLAGETGERLSTGCLVGHVQAKMVSRSFVWPESRLALHQLPSS